jgi:hypothetical protein
MQIPGSRISGIFWTIPGVIVYIYVITVLTQYGFLSYFDIPGNFIEASLRENIIYLYWLFSVFLVIVKIIGWWWILILPLAFLIYFLYDHEFKIIGTFALIAFAVFAAPRLGGLIDFA